MLLASDSDERFRQPSRFFVIEDDPDHQKIAEITLRAAGIEHIVFFDTGEAAMDFFLGVDPSGETEDTVILIDLMLPKIGGLEILKALKSNERWKSSKMVVLTCSNDAGDRICAKEYGADDFLTKPLCRDYVKRIFATRSH